MRLVLASFAATVLLATGAQAQDAPKQEPAPETTPIAGGFSDSEVTPEATKVANFAMAELDIAPERFDSIENLQTQVVAGMNYRFAIVLKDGHKWKVQVWSKLDGSYELTHSEEVHAH